MKHTAHKATVYVLRALGIVLTITMLAMMTNPDVSISLWVNVLGFMGLVASLLLNWVMYPSFYRFMERMDGFK